MLLNKGIALKVENHSRYASTCCWVSSYPPYGVASNEFNEEDTEKKPE